MVFYFEFIIVSNIRNVMCYYPNLKTKKVAPIEATFYEYFNMNYYASLLLKRITIKPEISNSPIPKAQFDTGIEGAP